MIYGDPSDADFWERMQASNTLEVIMLALPNVVTSIAVIQQLRASGYERCIAATARFPDQESRLQEAGADMVFNTSTEAGSGFAAHVNDNLEGNPGVPETGGSSLG